MQIFAGENTMAVITRFFNDIEVPSSGALITNIIEQQHSGFIDQIIIRDSSGLASTINVEIRYSEDQSTRESLVYLYEAGTMPLFVDSDIHGPFSLRDPDLEGKLSLFLEPNVDAILEIRIDFKLDRVPGAAS
jgi:hypothetical protein